MLEVAAASVHAPLANFMAIFPVGIEVAILAAFVTVIRPISIKMRIIEKDFFWRVRELIGSICESFASSNIFFVFGGAGDERVVKHDGEIIPQNT